MADNKKKQNKSDLVDGVVKQPPIDDYEIKAASENFLSSFLQSWGHDVETKIKALNRALAAAGIEAKFTQEGKNGEIKAGYECEEASEGERAAELRERLTNGWMLGEYQAEAARVEGIIREFRQAA